MRMLPHPNWARDLARAPGAAQRPGVPCRGIAGGCTCIRGLIFQSKPSLRTNPPKMKQLQRGISKNRISLAVWEAATAQSTCARPVPWGLISGHPNCPRALDQTRRMHMGMMPPASPPQLGPRIRQIGQICLFGQIGQIGQNDGQR